MNPLSEWLSTRPESVQRLAAEFPLGTMIEMDGCNWHLIGYTEDDKLIISTTDPHENYNQANETREYVCAEHLRPLRRAKVT